MCYKVSSSNFILNFFYENDATVVTVSALLQKKKEIEKALDYDIYVMLDSESLDIAMQYYSDLLRIVDNRIFCKQKKLRNHHSREDVNYALPLGVKAKYFELLKM